jgi:hypothetical protein
MRNEKRKKKGERRGEKRQWKEERNRRWMSKYEVI